MSAESFLSKQLQKFSLIDLVFVKSVYCVVTLLIFSLYRDLALLSYWFYGALLVICAFPIEVHLFSQPGNLLDKTRAYLKSNTPSNQVLLFLSVFFASIILGKYFPILVSGQWLLYVMIIIPLMAKPLTKTWFW